MFKILIILILSIVVGCTRANYRDNAADGIISVNFKKSWGNSDSAFYISTIIDTVEYIRIITPQDKDWIISDIADIKYVGGKFFIYEIYSHGIYVVSEDGIIENYIDYWGRGPEEYLAVYAFDVNSTTMEVAILDTPSCRIQIYSQSGQYIRSVAIEDIARDMAVLPNGDFLLYTPDYMEGNRRGLWRVDSNGQFKEHHVSISEDFLYGGIYPNYFRKISDSLVGLMGGEDYNRIYHIDCDTIRVAYQLNVDIEIPEEITRKKIFEFKTAPLGSVYTKNEYLETRGFMHVKVQGQNDNRVIYYDKFNKRILARLKRDSKIVNDYGFRGYFRFSSNNYLFTYLPVGAILEVCPEEFPDITEESNIVLVRFKLKDSFEL